MKTINILIASILLYISILMNTSCAVELPQLYPDINAGRDTTIILPTSSVMLSGSIDQQGYFLDHTKWELVDRPGNAPDVKIESPSSSQTNVTGLTKPGLYKFFFWGIFRGSRGAGHYSWYAEVTITIAPGTVALSDFTIGGDVFYTAQSVESAENYIRVSSFRNATDSGTMSFFFLSSTAIPAPGSAGDFKVVPVVRNADEVRVSAVRTIGNNGYVYDCTGTDDVKAHISVNASGKISINLPSTRAKLLLEEFFLWVSAYIYQP